MMGLIDLQVCLRFDGSTKLPKRRHLEFVTAGLHTGREKWSEGCQEGQAGRETSDGDRQREMWLLSMLEG